MPTPHIDCPRAKSDMTPCVLRDGELAADDRGCCVGCGERIGEPSPSHAGGGDAPDMSMEAVRARLATYQPLGSKARGVAGLAIAPDEPFEHDGADPTQTGGGDAGERPEIPKEVWRRSCLRQAVVIAELRAALRSSHRESAEAMRADCAKAARGPGGHDDCDHGAGYMDGRLDAALAVEALPIPGSKTDAG